MASTATPPLPPDVTSQQTGESPLSQYAEGQQAQQQPPQQQQQQSGIEMIETTFNEIAEKLNQIAQVASMVNPALIEYVKKMSQVGSAAMKNIQEAKQKQQKSQGSGPKAGLETARVPEGQGNAVAA